MLRSESCTSPATVAITAVAMSMLHLWKGNAAAFTAPNPALGKALARLQSALSLQHHRVDLSSSSSSSSSRYSAVLASLALQFYDDMLGQYDRARPLTMVHHKGAVGLLLASTARSTTTTTNRRGGVAIETEVQDRTLRARLLKNMLHLEIIYGLRTGSAISPRLTELLAWHDGGDAKHHSGYGSDVDHKPADQLDRMGLEVVNLNHLFCSGLEDYSLEQVADLDRRLSAWPSQIPRCWHPIVVAVNDEPSTSTIPVPSLVQTYSALGSYQVYPSVQLASIWNIWRLERLVLLRMKVAAAAKSTVPLLGSIHHEEAPHCNRFASTTGTSTSTAAPPLLDDVPTLRHQVQHMVDEICQSVPFHLGNRWKRGSLADFADKTIMQPSYRDFAIPTHAPPPLPRIPPPPTSSSPSPSSGGSHGPGEQHDSLLTSSSSAEAQTGHIIAQGPWHMRRTLGLLLGMLFRQRDGGELVACLREGQVAWMREQFVRTGVLLGID
ncbi:uncharacterized protein B0I36DRAFT_314533 [Microdochium trichocladiopsis]|uniref:Uncharacterized protein n=1 Tax=Microdochium trichocladiopsis TaxID=1682393 RepID=A0A9P9BUN1_9PEZI|nr:uncharacterized protein B0I36DRAFT_314533 [Microdochium trichocladiopsis]KAH7037649.1 hypothetical protein B0I36DRAFT_314533 [Microdochium trichocladiopsis]